MMPEKEVNETIHQQADPGYGKYEGNQTSSAHQQYETSNAQEVREGPSGKVYPLPRDHTNIFHFALVVISLLLLLVFGLVFVVAIGGTTGWMSFSAACFTICCILAYGYATIPRRH